MWEIFFEIGNIVKLMFHSSNVKNFVKSASVSYICTIFVILNSPFYYSNTANIKILDIVASTVSKDSFIFLSINNSFFF